MGQLDQSYNERLQKIEAWRNFERQSILDWFAAQKKQAYDDFHVSISLRIYIYIYTASPIFRKGNSFCCFS